MIKVEETSLYREYLAIREEVNKHKWYESEKVGRDIGFVHAMVDWSLKFKTQWLKERRKKN